MRRTACAALFAWVSAGPLGVGAQQAVDTSFHPRVERATYPANTGPLVLFDAAHNSMHSVDRSFRPFAELLRLDGYRFEALGTNLTADSLARAEIFVIVNVLAAENVGNWKLPTPSAYTPAEIEVVRSWVSRGGSLLLVADHMPFPGATRELARVFGFDFVNNFAIDTATWDPIVFRRSDGSLSAHAVTEGIDSIATFTGQAFSAPDSAITPLLTFGPGITAYEPATAWEFDGVPGGSATGMLQGAARTFGAGRVVVLGEAAMLTAQVTGPARRPMGMNAPVANQNQRFVLNVIHWLSKADPDRE